jgi:hypothetical protein
VALALRPAGPAQAHGAHEPGRSLRRGRRPVGSPALRGARRCAAELRLGPDLDSDGLLSKPPRESDINY